MLRRILDLRRALSPRVSDRSCGDGSMDKSVAAMEVLAKSQIAGLSGRGVIIPKNWLLSSHGGIIERAKPKPYSKLESASDYREVLKQNEIPTTTAFRW